MSVLIDWGSVDERRFQSHCPVGTQRHQSSVRKQHIALIEDKQSLCVICIGETVKNIICMYINKVMCIYAYVYI